MLITRETDYALRILRALTTGQIEKAAVISEQELIPRQFIYKILKKLQQANIVELRPGIGGGCRLLADLSQLSLYDVMEAMGDHLLVNACTDTGYHCAWEYCKGVRCSYHTALEGLQKQMEQELRQWKLAELCMQKS